MNRIKALRAGRLSYPSDVRERILNEVEGSIHENAKNWRTVFDIQGKKFNLIIDTFGELYYAGQGLGDVDKGYYFYAAFGELADKLKRGGQLFIACIPEGFNPAKIDDVISYLENRYKVSVDTTNEDRTRWVVTKLGRH